MKRIIMVMAVLGLLATSANAGLKEWIDAIPETHHGVAYSLADSNFNYSMTIDVATWKALTLEAGYSGRSKNTSDKVIGAVSVDLLKLKDFGVTWPILDLIELRPYVWFGVGNIQVNDMMDSETDYGVGCSIISVNF